MWTSCVGTHYSKNIKYSFVEEEQYENKVDEYINFDFENKKVIFEIENQNIKTYNKLVRDKIPAIIEEAGKRCVVETLGDFEFLVALDAKLDEELAEYHKDQSIEELADILEVVYTAALAHGYTREELERIRVEKAEKRGGFENKILLRKVEE